MYKFDKDTLEFIRVNWPGQLYKLVLGALIIIIMLSIIVPKTKRIIIDTEARVIVAKQNEFSEKKLTNLIHSLHFPFPEIVLAQAMHETAFFTSPAFKENSNLFGMKCAATRITTSVVNEGQYAYYHNWMDSVYDRALYSATYLSSIKTEDEYYSYLGQYYAEDSRYVDKLKELIVQKNLKSLFR